MAFDSKGDLFVATGDQGEIHRVTPDGTGSVFFKTEETHARSLAIDAQDNLIVGTEPSGLILRVSPAGQGFVLYQAPKREITAVAVDPERRHLRRRARQQDRCRVRPPARTRDAPCYRRCPRGGNVTVLTSNAPRTRSATGPAAARHCGRLGSLSHQSRRLAAQSLVQQRRTSSMPSGSTRKAGPCLAPATAAKSIAWIPIRSARELLDASPTQVTSFGKGAQRRAVRRHRQHRQSSIASDRAWRSSGTFESEVLDAGSFSYWGRISYRGTGNNFGIHAQRKSAIIPRATGAPGRRFSRTPAKKRSAIPAAAGARVSPAARFLQYKIELGAAAGLASSRKFPTSRSPICPRTSRRSVEAIEITPAELPLPAQYSVPDAFHHHHAPGARPAEEAPQPSLELSSSQTHELRQRIPGRALARLPTRTATRSIYKRGNPRRQRKSTWQLLKDDVKEKYWSWDSTAFPDGEYVLRVTASDSPSNPRDQALDASLVSDPFLIDNTPPQILNLAASASGNKVSVRWTAHDARSNIDKAEYSVNGGDWLLLEPVNKLTDSPGRGLSSGDRPHRRRTSDRRARERRIRQPGRR